MVTGKRAFEGAEPSRLALIEQTSKLLAAVDVPESMLISVVTPTRNRSARVMQTIESVQAQRYSRWEMLVVDDDSDDDTWTVLSAAAERDARIRTFHVAYSGPARARNHALDHARADVVVYLDDDNRFDPDWLRAVAWAFSGDAARDVLFGARMIDDIDRHRTGVAGGKPWVQFEPWDPDAEDFNAVDINVLAHRRSAVRFDPGVDFFSDWDLLTRLAERSGVYELPAIATYYATDSDDRMTVTTPRAEIDRQYQQVRANLARRYYAPMGELLAGKVAIVTGGGGGIGRGISELFAREGAAVVIAEIDGDRARETQLAITAAGGRAVTVIADVRDADTAEAVVTTARDSFDRVDVLVNNVGHFGGARKAFHEQTDDEWDDLYRVNLGHVLTCTRALLPVLIDQGDGGSIVNVSTIEAFRAIPTRAVYSAFKSAITGLTRSLAVEYGRYGIRINAIAPDVTETIQVPYSRFVRPEDEHMIPAWVPVGRFGTPADTAGVALFLASDLSGFVTGTTVHADGGTLASSGWFPTVEGGWTNRPRKP